MKGILMEARKFYAAVKIGTTAEEKVKEYLENFDNLKAFEALETTPRDRIHVTVLYLGEIPEAQAIEIVEEAAHAACFDAFVGEAMSFGNHALILRVYGSGLMVLHRNLSAKYQEVTGKLYRGFDKYVPHVTIAKRDGVRAGAAGDIQLGLASLINSPMMPFTVSSVGLYHKSELVHEVKLLGVS